MSLQRKNKGKEKEGFRVREEEVKAKDAEAERTQIRSALDQANKEIERLKTELEQQNANPPEQGNAVSQPPGE